jgi:peroxiredoxin
MRGVLASLFLLAAGARAQPPAFVSIPPAADDRLRFGEALPEFEAKDIGGRTWRLDDLRGKFTLIYLWHTFEARGVDAHDRRALSSVHGLPELPEVERFYRMSRTAGNIQVLTFCRDYDYTHAPEYMKEKGHTFPVIADWGLARRLFSGLDGVARQAVVSPDGRLSYPAGSWSLGRLLYEIEKVAGRN